MSSILKPTLSRWGRSVYETEIDVALESTILSNWVTVLDEYADANIIVLHSKQRFGADEVQHLSNVELVVTTTSGWEHMDVDFLKAKGIRCARMPMIRRDAVVESILGMLLHHNRRQWLFQDRAEQGHWARGELAEILPHRLQDQRIAVVGLGVIGQRLVQVLQSMGATVLGCDPHLSSEQVPDVPSVEWVDIPHQADVVLFACSHTKSSHQMVNNVWLSQCQNMVLINCARGKILDFESAMRALDLGQLAFLGLDVFPEEPFMNMERCRSRSNLLFTPHAAGYHPQLAKQIREGLMEIAENWIESHTVPFEL